jgi:hypothetical protein
VLVLLEQRQVQVLLEQGQASLNLHQEGLQRC